MFYYECIIDIGVLEYTEYLAFSPSWPRFLILTTTFAKFLWVKQRYIDSSDLH